ncbi:uncharacterized protein APUU_30175S [Aspergillus puulaauensis]|uniref:Uncharacterized protein n=1 Tax=Aspergillus puulaauensis TaxID=1220207 RepID=A0A7R7XI86_9EURO|nr:uncharacterized protein APUU_30175S [Aspergillus puulaauensis]BCS21950.1 hypothetical protein APUU_30175S [Aspergillus puulaauensis]
MAKLVFATTSHIIRYNSTTLKPTLNRYSLPKTRMSRLSHYNDIEEGEIIETRKPSSRLAVRNISWGGSNRPVSPAREARRMAEPYQNSYKRPQASAPAPRYETPGSASASQPSSKLKLTLEELELEWGKKSPPAGRNGMKMTVRGYVRAVERLLEEDPVIEPVGSGTVDDPRIIWISKADDRPRGRVAGIERICRLACAEMKTTKIWIRKYDHGTTRTFTQTARGKIERTISEDDPHITVYMGHSEDYLYEGHIYIGYSKANPYIPARLAEPEERRFAKDGNKNPIPVLDRQGLRREAYAMGLLPIPIDPDSDSGVNSSDPDSDIYSKAASKGGRWRPSATDPYKIDTWRPSSTVNSYSRNTKRYSNADSYTRDSKRYSNVDPYRDSWRSTKY